MRGLFALWLALLPGLSAAQTVTRGTVAPVPVTVATPLPAALPQHTLPTVTASPTLFDSPHPSPPQARGSSVPAKASPLALAAQAEATGWAIAKEAELAAVAVYWAAKRLKK